MNSANRKSFAVKFDAEHRRCELGGEPLVLHCHHYNTFLQQTIQDADYVDSRPFLVGAANEVAYSQLSELFRSLEVEAIEMRISLAEEIFRWAGFGRVELGGITSEGGVVSTPHSHYAHAWKAKFGPSSSPVDFFTTGWLSGALAAVFELPQGAFSCSQTECMAMGGASNRYELTRSETPNFSIYASPKIGALSAHKLRDSPQSNVDFEGIYSALSSMNIEGNEEGVIPAFGVYLTRHYANYYNRISFEFTNALISKIGEDGAAIAEPLLVEAGHVCAFNTFGGIMTSSEWDALILPTLKSKEDWVQGMVAAVNALGWGRWQATRVSENEAEFVIYDDYESVGHLAAYGETERPVAHLAMGAAMGIMNLVYLGEVQNKPEFNEAFYNHLFRSEASYQGELVESRAAGAEATVLRVYKG